MTYEAGFVQEMHCFAIYEDGIPRYYLQCQGPSRPGLNDSWSILDESFNKIADVIALPLGRRSKKRSKSSMPARSGGRLSNPHANGADRGRGASGQKDGPACRAKAALGNASIVRDERPILTTPATRGATVAGRGGKALPRRRGGAPRQQ
jgi:hypothetical protein